MATTIKKGLRASGKFPEAEAKVKKMIQETQEQGVECFA